MHLRQSEDLGPRFGGFGKTLAQKQDDRSSRRHPIAGEIAQQMGLSSPGRSREDQKLAVGKFVRLAD